MKKTNKEKVKEFIRVDHAGERGAVKIYEGQLLALNTFVKDIKIFIVARDKPKILKVASLQLTVTSCSWFKSASLVKSALLEFKSQTKDSFMKPCSIPKW